MPFSQSRAERERVNQHSGIFPQIFQTSGRNTVDRWPLKPRFLFSLASVFVQLGHRNDRASSRVEYCATRDEKFTTQSPERNRGLVQIR